MTNYEEIVRTKTDDEIKLIIHQLRMDGKPLEVNQLTATYILYHGTETDSVLHDTPLMQGLRALDSMRAEVLQKHDTIETADKFTISGILGFLIAKSALLKGITRGVSIGNQQREIECGAFHPTAAEKHNSFMLFNVYCNRDSEMLIRKYAEFIEPHFSEMIGYADLIKQNTLPSNEAGLNILYEQWKDSSDTYAEGDRVQLKNLLICTYCYYYFMKDFDKGYLFLEKALAVTNSEEVEYNILKFLLKELRLAEQTV